MGVAPKAERKVNTGPECPAIFTGVHEKYRELKFIQRLDEEVLKLIPREMLTWQDLRAYTDITGRRISYFDAELIMGLDAIFEGRNDG